MIKITMGFNPLIKKYKRIRDNRMMNNVKANKIPYVIALFAIKTIMIKAKTQNQFCTRIKSMNK